MNLTISTGVSYLDGKGRVTIPLKMRKELGWEKGIGLLIERDEKDIVIRELSRFRVGI